VETFQDTNPTDSNPQGWIYDWDHPRLARDIANAGEIKRARVNFTAFAQITVPESPTGVRASCVTEYYVRMSIEQLDCPSGDNWNLVDDVPDDNEGWYGTTPLTWNLQ
jgi:hypothetical protein